MGTGGPPAGPLDDAIRRRDAVLLAVAHDLRGPVSALSGAVEVLRASLPGLDPDTIGGVLDAMQAAIGEVDSVMVDLLDVERLEHGAGEVVRAPTDLRSLVQRAVRRISELRPVQMDVDDAIVQIDPGLGERILVNLVINAHEHTPIGTPITVCARDCGDHVLFHIDDAGPGIPLDLREVIFEPFHPSTGRGIGVGLYLVRAFANMHGGDAWIEDLPDEGTSVRVRLPTT